MQIIRKFHILNSRFIMLIVVICQWLFDLYSHQIVLVLEERKSTINQSVYIALAGSVVCLYFKTFKQSKSNKSNIFCSFNTIQIKVKTNKPQDNLKMIIMSS